jgi:hypothetical protein
MERTYTLRLIVERRLEIKPGLVLAPGVYPGRTEPMGRKTEYRINITAQQLASAGVRVNLFSREYTVTNFVQSGDIAIYT